MHLGKRTVFATLAGAAALLLIGCATGGAPMAAGHPAEGWYYKVVTGDSLNAIAQRYGRPVETIAKVNKLGNPALLYEGLYIWIPPLANVPQTKIIPVSAQLPPSQTKSSGESLVSRLAFWRSTDPPKENVSPTRPLDPSLLGDGARVLNVSARSVSALQEVAKAPDAKKLGFHWPLDRNACKVVKTNRGVDLLAPEGTPVRASRSGMVIASGSPLRGYGNMILVDHEDGYISVYAHNKENLVQKGQFVRRGDTIAKVGSTGSAEAPKLHFEIRRRTEPVDDPRAYLVE
ncbi:MAG: LysM peptidoglycan-binding domain-containing M23 family metallopeptidase [Candidatus Sumerlaeota bacterium]|nr:LysM peptidoglycan-binding domain-containing M23 family metallopeptidase [Candidatus Sumerlaeota bacterium]